MHFSSSDLSLLSRRERLAFEVARAVNESPRAKSASHWFNVRIGRRWMNLVSGARIRLVGVEKMTALRPDRGVVLAANHRSYFDLYMITTHLHGHVDWLRRAYFPVKSSFFYEGLLGLAVNAAMSGLAMYPPIFRENEKRPISRAGLDFIAEKLAEPGTVVGIHPEGTRGKGPDPYELLPGEPGFGRLVLQARPIVVPIFVNGLINDLAKDVWSTFDGTGAPIVIVFGDPVDLRDFEGRDPTRVRSQMEVTRRVLARIAELGEIDRRVRAES